jgi:hypothetical protein
VNPPTLHLTNTAISFVAGLDPKTSKPWTKEAINQMKMVGTIKETKGKRSLIVAYVSQHIWHYIKFLVPPDLDSVADGSACHAMAAHFHVPVEHRDVWWNGAPNPKKNDIPVKKLVTDKLGEKRSGAAQNMKRKFHGMFLLIYSFVHFVTNTYPPLTLCKSCHGQWP